MIVFTRLRCAGSTRSTNGFVLVSTLWVLAGLTLLGSYIALLSEDNIEKISIQRDRFLHELERKSTESTLLYYLATNPASHRGLVIKSEQEFSDFKGDDPVITIESGDKQIWFDGSVYKGLGDIYFSIQDESGLISVNSPSIPLLRDGLLHIGVSAANTAILIDRLKDYLDSDSLPRLNGAEFYEYRQAGLPQPVNGLLITPDEFKNILGFGELISAEQWERLYPLLTMRQAVGYNFNVMPKQVMSVLLGVDESSADRLITLRHDHRITNAAEIQRATGALINFHDDDLLNTPSRYLQISTWVKGEEQARLTGIELMPFVLYAPWRIDYRYSRVRNVQNLEQSGGVSSPFLQ